MHWWQRWERLRWLGCFGILPLGQGAPVEEEKEAEAMVHTARAEKAWRAGNVAMASSTHLDHGGTCSGASRARESAKAVERKGETERGLGQLQIEARRGQGRVAWRRMHNAEHGSHGALHRARGV